MGVKSGVNVLAVAIRDLVIGTLANKNVNRSGDDDVVVVIVVIHFALSLRCSNTHLERMTHLFRIQMWCSSHSSYSLYSQQSYHSSN